MVARVMEGQALVGRWIVLMNGMQKRRRHTGLERLQCRSALAAPQFLWWNSWVHAARARAVRWRAAGVELRRGRVPLPGAIGGKTC